MATNPMAQLNEAIARLTDEQVLGLVEVTGVDLAIGGVFNEMQRRFRPDRAAGTDVVLQWDLSMPSGDRSYQSSIRDGTFSWWAGVTEAAALMLSCTVTDFLRLMIGQLDSTEAFMTGRLRVFGDLPLTQEMAEWFDLGVTPSEP